MPRQDTKLESEGAEFLVLGQLLINRIASYKTYTNMAGYDLVATHPENNTSARIQVKSRWRTGAPGFLISNFACDFVVAVRLNRGNKTGTAKILSPEYYVFPVDVVKAARHAKGWRQVFFKKIPDVDTYRERWDLIESFLAADVAACLSDKAIETLTKFAVQFDGYRYLDEINSSMDFRPLVVPRVESMSLQGSHQDNWAAFFGLQRFLHKWGGERLPITSKQWSCYLMLYLHLHDKPFPKGYESDHTGFDKPTENDLADAAAEVRDYFATTLDRRKPAKEYA
jgi:hypothetical protein